MSSSADGIGTLVILFVISGLLMTLVTGSLGFWLLLIPGIFVGLVAASSIR